MKKAGNKVIISIAAVAAAVCVCCFMSLNSGERLTDEEIQALRDEYPVCGKSAPALISMKTMTLDEVKKAAESFVYGEVVGGISTYNVTASLANKALAEKRAESGIADVFDFYEYTISVIDDTEGLYSKGEEITIAANVEFIDYNPTLSEGMRVVVPVVRDKEKTTRNHYVVEGMYYVTPEGYALAAFDEEKAAVPGGASSGVTVEALLKKLKK